MEADAREETRQKMKPRFIRIGDCILNLDHVKRIDIESPDLLNVYMVPTGELIQSEEKDAHTLLDALKTGYLFSAKTYLAHPFL
jgi:hypothetical protein